jgi:competence protein ComEC
MKRLFARAPFMRIGIPFMMGIAAQHWCELDVIVTSVLMLSSLLIWTVLSKMSFWKMMSYRWCVGMTFLFHFFFTGWWVSSVCEPAHHPFHYLHRSSEHQFYIVQLKDEPTYKNNSHRVSAEIQYSSDSTGVFLPTTGEVMMYFYKDSIAETLHVDDVILVEADLAKPSPPRMKGSFDYSQYLKNKGIYRTLSPKKHKWIKWDALKKNTFGGYFIRAREFFISLMDRYNVPSLEKGILAALVWGKATEIDSELMQTYSRAGVVHVLAVSGLHVGLVYAVLHPILARLVRGNRSRWIRFIIPTILLWVYAGLTGFSPSVLRAAVMFTCFIISEQFHQSKESFNTLFASAFILLLFNPSLLFNLGFHLSYLAVIGIMTLQRPIELLYKPRQWLLIHIWKMCAVSIAAQLVTLPLCLLFFHQFPTYFLLANILAIPISTVILYVCLLFFVFHAWTPLAYLLINLSTSLTALMNKLMTFCDRLPHSLFENIPFDAIHFLCSYVFLFSITQWLVRKKKIYATVSLACIACFMGWSVVQIRLQEIPYELSIRKIKSDMVIMLREGRKFQFFAMAADSVDQNAVIQQMKDITTPSYYPDVAWLNLPKNSLLLHAKRNGRRINIQFLQKKSKHLYHPDLLVLPKAERKARFKFEAQEDSLHIPVIIDGYWSDKKLTYLQNHLKWSADEQHLLTNQDYVIWNNDE